MKQPADPLKERLQVVRNLTVTAYGAASQGGALKAQIADDALFQRVNHLIFKIKQRFDSFKVFIQTVPNGSHSDGAIALAESMLSHTSILHKLLVEAGHDERSLPFAEACAPYLMQFEESADQVTAQQNSEALKSSMRLPGQLKKAAPDLAVLYLCAATAARLASEIRLNPSEGLAKVIREITFPPEYQQAGLSILNYFSAVLHDKYPNMPVTVSIQQHPDKVTLLITLPDGRQEQVSKLLSDYGLVVTGKMTPRELVGDDIKALALQQKLELAQLEVRQTRELLRMQEQYANKRVESLENEVKNLYTLLGREFTSRENLQTSLLQFASKLASGHVGDQASLLVQSLASAVAERNTERTRVVLEDIQSSEPALFDRLNEFFLHAATSGVIGNYVYDWLKIIWPILPK
ncbi:MAG: hypothetical protein IPG42_07905 [Betaproteobacteria bacterium]|nr:hypothetical protein [Betaproteobacteria bacterium]